MTSSLSTLRLGAALPLIALLAGCGPGGGATRDPSLDCPSGECDLETQIFRVDPAPPPVSGGTLLVTRDGKLAVAADSDRDRVWIVDLVSRSLTGSVSLHAGDEPGRVVEDAAGRIHVVLRRAGAIVTVDPRARQVLGRRDVCPAPRGLAYDEALDALHVACVGGELVTLPAADAGELRRLRLDRDLRDIVVAGDRLLVSRFRTPEVFELDAGGEIVRRGAPANGISSGNEMVPRVAWRTASAPDGVVMVHQLASTGEIPRTQVVPYYAQSCASTILSVAVTRLRYLPIPQGVDPVGPEVTSFVLPPVALPVDVAVSPDATRLAVVAAGSDQLITFDMERFGESLGPCQGVEVQPIAGTPVAVAFAGSSTVVQTRERAGLVLLPLDVVIAFEAEVMKDTGHDLFHTNVGPTGNHGPIVCASCHPEGRDDAHVWKFEVGGLRRTQPLGGGILQTAPLHWDGMLPELGALMDEVFVNRMGGAPQPPARVTAFASWIDALPVVPASPATNPEAVSRGAELFFDPAVGCSSCHAGERYTNNTTVDVGTGMPAQVPTLLGLASRAPYMHTGCASTLRARFDPACGGGDQHGKTSHLSEGQLEDLVAFLETL